MVSINNKKLCEYCFAETDREPCPQCGFSREAYEKDLTVLEVGSVLEHRYLIGGVIGKGGFGITYLAYDMKLERKVAIKEYYPYGLAMRNIGSTFVSATNAESAEVFKGGADKFYDEARLMAKFNDNPNIVSVHDFFYENDTVYFTMGFLNGQTLKAYLREHGVLSPGQAVCVASDIVNALIAAHHLNVLHRDISPDNIMVCSDGSIKLLDFGAARQVLTEGSQSLSVILKQGFAPLEQYQKKGKQGPWTDIYALGATLYYALTLDLLDDPMSRLEDDSEYSSNIHGIEEPLWEVIRKATMLKSSERYHDILELKAALDSLPIRPIRLTVPGEATNEMKFEAAARTGTASHPMSSAPEPPHYQGGAAPMPMQKETADTGVGVTMPLREEAADTGVGVTMPLQENAADVGVGVTMPLREEVADADVGVTMPLQENAADVGVTMPLRENAADVGVTMPLQEKAPEPDRKPARPTPQSEQDDAVARLRELNKNIDHTRLQKMNEETEASAEAEAIRKNFEKEKKKKIKFSVVAAGIFAVFMLVVFMVYNTRQFEYITYSDFIKIVKYLGKDTEVEIPSEIRGKPVTIIGDKAFLDCSSLTSVIIPDSVTEIGPYAFSGCRSLTSVTIPDSVTEIGEGAFDYCSSLTSVTIPASVTKIVKGTFFTCSSLTSVIIPDSVTEIGGGAFAYCRSLTSVTIPDSVTQIDYITFLDCSSLTRVTIPDSVTEIGESAFQRCTHLTSAIIPEHTKVDDSAFEDCPNLTITRVSSTAGLTEPGAPAAPASAQSGEADTPSSTLQPAATPASEFEYWEDFGVIAITSYKGGEASVVIPSEIEGKPVKEIEPYAFSGCSSLTSITIPDSVTLIRRGAFGGCSSLTSITIPDSVTLIDSGAFGGCSSLTSITIPDSVTLIAGDTFNGCSSLTSITIPDSVMEIEIRAFRGCSSLTSITIPDSVTEIGASAFWGCSSLTSITIPDSVTEIGDHAFEGCSSLTSMTISDSVANIGWYAFKGCSSLTSAIIPEHTSVGTYAFDGCPNLTITRVSSSAGLTKPDASAPSAQPDATHTSEFEYTVDNGEITITSYKGGESSVVIPSEIEGKPVTEIKYAFMNCFNLTSITIPDSVTEIGIDAFDGCSSLTSIIIPDSVTEIGISAFKGCSSLTSIIIPDSVMRIGMFAFEGCSSLTSVIILDSVTVISAGVFEGCSSLTSVTIPDSVKKIAIGAFEGCSSLTSITIPNSVKGIDIDAFKDCSSLTSAIIPEHTTVDSTAFDGCPNLTITRVK